MRRPVPDTDLAAPRDATPRTAVISAFAPELAALLAATAERNVHEAAGVVFTTGRLEGRAVVLFLSGMSMVNAAMSTQAALDRFRIERIVFSGVAGGADPALSIGDVVAPRRWGQYLECHFGRETGDGFAGPTLFPQADAPRASFGMMHPQAVEVARGGGPPERRFWFPVDPQLYALAEAMPTPPLRQAAGELSLPAPPRFVVGGAGVSGPAFVDNAAFRDHAARTFGAVVLDMETAAVAHVAHANAVPFIAFRSLSDLAGGEGGEAEAQAFFQLAGDNAATVVRAFLRALPLERQSLVGSLPPP